MNRIINAWPEFMQIFVHLILISIYPRFVYDPIEKIEFIAIAIAYEISVTMLLLCSIVVLIKIHQITYYTSKYKPIIILIRILKVVILIVYGIYLLSSKNSFDTLLRVFHFYGSTIMMLFVLSTICVVNYMVNKKEEI